jgi:hypothetical protein
MSNKKMKIYEVPLIETIIKTYKIEARNGSEAISLLTQNIGIPIHTESIDSYWDKPVEVKK